MKPPPKIVNAITSGNPPPTDRLEPEKQELLQSLVEQSGPKLSPSEKELFYQLHSSYADVFAGSTADLGMTDRLRYSINTGDALPLRQPVRCIPPPRWEKVRRLVRDMLEGDVVEPSTSPWASPIVLGKKKDGSTRTTTN